MVMSTKRICQIFALFLLQVFSQVHTIHGQYGDNYDQDYAQDNLYHDYAMRQQEKEAAAAGYVDLSRASTGKLDSVTPRGRFFKIYAF